MQFKKSQAILSAVLAAAMASSALMTCTASAAGTRTKTEKFGDDTYAHRYLSMYDDVITNGGQNGYLSDSNAPSGGFGVPYHAIEEVICEAPDYGHETTSEAMSYIVWIAAMEDNLMKKENGSANGDLAKAWKTLEVMIPTEQSGFWAKSELSSQVSKEHPDDITKYPSEGDQSNVGKNPLHSKFTSAYSGDKGEYLVHWLADVDDWYGFGGSAQGTKGKFTFINTFQRGDQESCFETIPHPAVEELKYGNSSQGMKFAFQKSTAASWSYTNAPDAEDRAIQAVYAANRWGVGDASVTKLAGKMGDELRNDMFDKYYKKLGCQSFTADSNGGGLDGQHFLMSWYTAWGGAADGSWAWQIGCSHSHQFYQNPLAAYGLLYDSGLNSAMLSDGATKDYTESLKRQLEMYEWLQSADGMFAGGCSNCYNGDYSAYPSGLSQFYKMCYVEHPVYADPGSNHWIGNQVWSTQRLAELYYVIKQVDKGKNGSDIKPGGMSMEEALSTMLEKWVAFFNKNVKLTDDGDYEIPASLDWSGQPVDWKGSFDPSANSGLTCKITATGNSDLGCVSSLADTLIYYAAAEGVPASAATEGGSSEAAKGLKLANELLSREWKLGRDDLGCSRLEHNGSLTRFFEQEVYIPAGTEGKYPYGYTVKNGSKFCDLRPMYEGLEKYDELKAAWEKDVAAGAKYDDATSDTSQFKNVAAVDLSYHRFWHAGDILMAMGAMAELYPDVLPADGSTAGTTTTTTTTTEKITPASLIGDVNCNGSVGIEDVILLSRYVANDDVDVTAQGIANAACDSNASITMDDVTAILTYIARQVKSLPVD